MKEKKAGVNTGISLMLVIFVVMCIVTFAVLSYSSAMSDYNLSMKAVERTKLYYQACNRSEEIIARYSQNPSLRTDDILEFTEDIGVNHYLNVKAKWNDEIGKYEILEWSVNYKKEN